jgi:pSer/pThr/pTyr-binding forkhead associated (FHA) protein
VLRRDGEQWLLVDLGSTNGTRLNGWRITRPVAVRPGDRVAFGSVKFCIVAR